MDRRAARRREHPAIVSCSALKRAYRERIIGARPGVRLVYLQGQPCSDRRAPGRAQGALHAGIACWQSQFAALEEPGADERPSS